MSKEAASSDLQAAAYWKGVARADKADGGVAVSKVTSLTTAARSEEKDSGETQRRSKGLRPG